MAVVSIKNKLRRGNLLVGNDAYAPPSFESIATVSGSSQPLTLSNIPGTYQHLQFRGILKPSSAGVSVLIRLNSSTSNYRTHYLSGNGTATEAGSIGGNTYLYFMNQAGVPSTTYFVPFILDIHDYASTTKNKTLRMFIGSSSNSTGVVGDSIELSSGLWVDTSAITSISFYNGTGGGWSTGSTISLYGIKGA